MWVVPPTIRVNLLKRKSVFFAVREFKSRSSQQFFLLTLAVLENRVIFSSWLFQGYKFAEQFYVFQFLSDEQPSLKTFDFVFRSTPTFLSQHCLHSTQRVSTG